MTDVVIIGGGPAGLTLGCYLAKSGIPCLILEKAHHPRPHVGESLMPATVRILREIGFHRLVEEAGFPHSGGVVYHTPEGKSVPVSYGEFPQDGVDQDYTYHVDRSKFDLFLLKHAESLGCQVVEGANVHGVLFDERGAAQGVRATFGEHAIDIPAKLVVDAGGRATRLGRQLQLRQDHPVLDQFALHAWFEGVDLGERKTRTYTHVYFLPEVRGWAWQAPIDAAITSIGLVADKRAFQEADVDIDDFFRDSLEFNPRLSEAMMNSTQLNEITGDANYSYKLDRLCGDGWMAIGDAALFLDPVFSSGVSVAMHTARYAAERIRVAVDAQDFGRDMLFPYEDKLMASAAAWDDFVRLFYRLLPSFTHLLESPEHRLPLLRMIQGDVHAEGEAGVLREMRALVRTVEEADEHPWKGSLLELRGA